MFDVDISNPHLSSAKKTCQPSKPGSFPFRWKAALMFSLDKSLGMLPPESARMNAESLSRDAMEL